MTLNRRHLLAGAAVLALCPRTAFASANAETDALLSLLPDRDTAAKLGAIWAQQARKEPGEIFESLRQRLRWSPDAAETTFRHNLANAISDDFRGGAVEKVEGWQIARTQIELCGLAYFSAAGRL